MPRLSVSTYSIRSSIRTMSEILQNLPPRKIAIELASRLASPAIMMHMHAADIVILRIQTGTLTWWLFYILEICSFDGDLSECNEVPTMLLVCLESKKLRLICRLKTLTTDAGTF